MMVGSLNWVVTLGQFDVHYATQTMARYNMVPRQGHFETMKRIFGYLKHHAKMQIVYDTELPGHMDYQAVTYNWFEHYEHCTEELPHDMPMPKGNPVRITAFFDANHAGCLSTRRSTTGILTFLNNTHVKSYSKRQSTVESSTYSSETVAGRIAVETAIEMRYKLRMLGIPVLGSCLLFGDNMSMVISTTIPSSALKKKHNAIGYHRVREAIAARIIDLLHVPSRANLADLLTKPLGPQIYKQVMELFWFPTLPRIGKHDGECQSEINNETVDDGQGTTI